MNDKMYLISESDLEFLKDHVVGMSLDGVVKEFDAKSTSDAISEEDSEKIQELLDKVDVLRKAYVMDVHLVQNKYQFMLEKVLCELYKYQC